jgi:hypothetical protein
VAELVDALDLGSSVLGRVGSSPIRCTSIGYRKIAYFAINTDGLLCLKGIRIYFNKYNRVH